VWSRLADADSIDHGERGAAEARPGVMVMLGCFLSSRND
jgi:hypothetical protein